MLKVKRSHFVFVAISQYLCVSMFARLHYCCNAFKAHGMHCRT